MFYVQHALGREMTPEKDYFISIKSPDYAPIPTPFGEDNACHLEFWDIDDPMHEYAPKGFHALKIADFIRKVRDRNGNIWVNCHAGISRSGAVVETLLRLGWTDLEHPCQETRYPNPLLMRLLQKEFPYAFEGEYTSPNSDLVWGAIAQRRFMKG